MIFPIHSIDSKVELRSSFTYLTFILNQDNLVQDLSKSNSLPLLKVLFIGEQVELEGDLSKFNDIPYVSSFHPGSSSLDP